MTAWSSGKGRVAHPERDRRLKANRDRVVVIGDGWSDIETAPKNGCEILALEIEDGAPLYWLVIWNSECWECAEAGKLFDPGKLKFWQPLPAPPC